MSNPTGIAAEKYVSITTYKTDGTPKALPVWIAELPDGRLGFTTPSDSWKVKRIANDPRVLLQPSNSRGVATVGSEAVSGTAAQVTGDEFERVRALVKSKYGYQFAMMTAVGKVRSLFGSSHAADSALIITLGGAPDNDASADDASAADEPEGDVSTDGNGASE